MSSLLRNYDKVIENNIEQEQVKRVKQSLSQIVKSILNEEFGATPSYAVCRNCEFWSICDQKETEE